VRSRFVRWITKCRGQIYLICPVVKNKNGAVLLFVFFFMAFFALYCRLREFGLSAALIDRLPAESLAKKNDHRYPVVVFFEDCSPLE
jgi:hypothetical protein